MRKLITIAALLLVCAVSRAGMDHFKHIEGFQQNTILCSMQDSRGFMWFGTKDGLCRYDGYKLRNFQPVPGDPSSLGNGFVYCICEMPDESLWIGTGNGVYIYNPKTEQFSRFEGRTPDGFDTGGEIHCIVPDAEGNLWIGAYWKGLFRVDASTRQLSCIRYVDGTTKGLLSNGIWAVVADGDRIWTGSAGGGLNEYDPRTGEIRFHDLLSITGKNDVMSMIPWGEDRLLLGTADKGVIVYDKTSGNMQTLVDKPEGGGMYVRSMLIDPDNVLWIGSESGLYEFHLEDGILDHQEMDYSDRFSLSSNAVYSICRDSEGGMWFGTYFGGINYLSPYHNFIRQYIATGSGNGLSGNAVREFIEDRDGNLWIGTEDNGLNYFDRRSGSFKHFTPGNSPLTGTNVHGLCLLGDTLLVGYFLMGMDVVDLKTMEVQNYQRTNQAGGISDSFVASILHDSSGRIWVGTAAGLNIFDIRNRHFSRVNEVGPTSFIYDLFEDSRSRIWVGTYYDGIYRYDQTSGEWRHYNFDEQQKQSLSSLHIISISEDISGNIWVGTEGGGACRYSELTDRFEVFTTLDGLPSNTVHKIICDREGAIWLSTNNGIARYDSASGRFYSRLPESSIMSRQFNYKSGILASDGTLFFGSIQGMISIGPYSHEISPLPPPVVITSFDLLTKQIRPAELSRKRLVLDHDQNTFSIGFSALSYDSPEKNQYMYRLRGLEDEWTSLYTNQVVKYTKVPQGRYVFEVKAANSSGVWNEQGTSLNIRIKPSLFLSPVGLSIEALLLIALVYCLLQMKEKRDRQKRQLEIDSVRAAEASASQEARLTMFANMTHEIRTPLALIQAPFEQICRHKFDDKEICEDLDIMGANISRLIRVADEALDYSKIESDSFKVDLAPADIGLLLQQSMLGFKRVFKDNSLNVSVIVPEKKITALTDSNALNKIFTNLISNAAKFAESSITMELSDSLPEEGWFRFRISNDGGSISPDNFENVFKPFFQEQGKPSMGGFGLGLSIVRQLCSLLNGRIGVKPDECGGVTFTLDFPKGDVKEPAATSDIADSIPESPDETEGRSTVILAEDDPTMRGFLKKELSKHYRVIDCNDGTKVLEELGSHETDIIVTDLMMPGMDGLELCRTLKGSLEYSHIPIIMLTAYGDTQTIIKALETGVDAFVEKPFSIDYLLARIANLINRIRSLQASFKDNPEMKADDITTNATDASFIKKITAIILEHKDEEDFGIDKMAEVMGISRTTLYRKVKAVSQLPPNEFIKVCKLKYAASLLDDGVYRVSEICYLAGFNSPSYFAKCFQQQFLLSPREYAKRKK